MHRDSNVKASHRCKSQPTTEIFETMQVFDSITIPQFISHSRLRVRRRGGLKLPGSIYKGYKRPASHGKLRRFDRANSSDSVCASVWQWHCYVNSSALSFSIVSEAEVFCCCCCCCSTPMKMLTASGGLAKPASHWYSGQLPAEGVFYFTSGCIWSRQIGLCQISALKKAGC